MTTDITPITVDDLVQALVECRHIERQGLPTTASQDALINELTKEDTQL